MPFERVEGIADAGEPVRGSDVVNRERHEDVSSSHRGIAIGVGW